MAYSLLVLCALSQLSADEPTAAVDAEQTPHPAGAEIDFRDDVLPILQANCIACHNRTNPESDLVLESAEAMLTGGSLGPAIDLNAPDTSLLLQLASHREEPVMPPEDNDVGARKLSAEELNLLRGWIAAGARMSSANSTVLNWQPINSALVAVYALETDWEGRFMAAGRGSRVTVYDRAVGDRAEELIDPALKALVPAAAAGVAHRDFVQAIAARPDGSQIATAGYQVIKLWRRRLRGSPVALPATSAPAVAWQFSSDGSQTLAINDSGLQLHSLPDPSVVLTLVVERETITAADRFSGTDNLLVVGNDAGDLLLIDEATQQPTDRLHVSDHPLASVLIHPNTRQIAALGEDGTVAFATISEDGTLTQVSSVVLSECRSIHWSSDSLVAHCGTGQLKRLQPADASIMSETTIDAEITQLAAAFDSDRLAVVTSGHDCRLLAAADFSQVAALNNAASLELRRKRAEYGKSVADARLAHLKSVVTAREKELADQIKVKDAATEALRTATDELTKAQGQLDATVAAAAEAAKVLESTPDAADAKAAVEKATKDQDAAMAAVAAAEKKVKLQTQDETLAAAGVDRFTAAVAEVSAAAKSAEEDVATVVAHLELISKDLKDEPVIVGTGFLMSGDVIATCDQAGTARFFQAATGRPLDVFRTSETGIEVKRFVTAPGNAAMLTMADGSAAVRPCEPEWFLAATLPAESDGPLFTERVNSLAWSPDGSLLAAGGGEASRSGVIAVWNTIDWRLEYSLTDVHSDVVYGLEFSPDSRFLASASADKFARVFEAATGRPVRTLEGHTNQVMDVAWNAAQSLIATAGADNAIKIWNVDTGLQQRTVSTYSKQVSSVQFTDTGTSLLSCSGDQRVFLHNAANGKPIRELPRSPDYVHVAVSDGPGTIVAAGCEDGHIRIWNAADGKQIADLPPATK